MNSRTSRLLLQCLLLSICSSCESNTIKLETVRNFDLPEYIATDKHFGTDLNSMQELNNFLLVTGKIDTTSEFSPEELAIIKISGTTYFMHRTEDKTANGETRQAFDGNGYHIKLQYKKQGIVAGNNIYEGELIIKGSRSSSAYLVTGTDGYH